VAQIDGICDCFRRFDIAFSMSHSIHPQEYVEFFEEAMPEKFRIQLSEAG